MTDATPFPAADAARGERRRRRLVRELAALRAMEAALVRREFGLALLAVPGVGLLWLGVFLKFKWLSGSLPLAALVALVLGAAVWWIGRRFLTIAVLIVMGLLLVLFEDAGGLEPPPGDDRTARRRAKLDRAIARREALLRSLA